MTVPRGGPTLGTIRMVEQTLRDAPDDRLVSVAHLKRMLPRQINHNTLLEILAYLQESGRILVGVKGVLFLRPPSAELQAVLQDAYAVTWRDGKPEFSRYRPQPLRDSRRDS